MTIQILNISKYRLRLPSKMIDEVNHKRLPWQGEIKFYLNIVLLKCRKYIDGLFLCVCLYNSFWCPYSVFGHLTEEKYIDGSYSWCLAIIIWGGIVSSKWLTVNGPWAMAHTYLANISWQLRFGGQPKELREEAITWTFFSLK